MDVGRPDLVGIPGLGSRSGQKNAALLVRRAHGHVTTADEFFKFFCESEVAMNHANAPVDRIKIGLRITLLAAVMGFLGIVDRSYGNPVGFPEPTVLVPVPSVRVGLPVIPVPVPDIYLFGGGYDRGRDVNDYRRRGAESRGAAHRDHDDHGRRR